MAVQASHRRLLPATRDDTEPLALLRKHRRKPQKSMPSTDPEPRGPRAAIRLVPSRNMPLGRTSIPEFPDSGPPHPPSQHIEMSACFPSSSHRGRTHAVQTRGARDKILPVLRSCGRYVVALYNEVRPHSSLDYLTPNEFAARAARSAPRNATGRGAAVDGASAPRPVAEPSPRGQLQPAREAVSS
jgi:hypothetical protein